MYDDDDKIGSSKAFTNTFGEGKKSEKFAYKLTLSNVICATSFSLTADSKNKSGSAQPIYASFPTLVLSVAIGMFTAPRHDRKIPEHGERERKG